MLKNLVETDNPFGRWFERSGPRSTDLFAQREGGAFMSLLVQSKRWLQPRLMLYREAAARLYPEPEPDTKKQKLK